MSDERPDCAYCGEPAYKQGEGKWLCWDDYMIGGYYD